MGTGSEPPWGALRGGTGGVVGRARPRRIFKLVMDRGRGQKLSFEEFSDRPMEAVFNLDTNEDNRLSLAELSRETRNWSPTDGPSAFLRRAIRTRTASWTSPNSRTAPRRRGLLHWMKTAMASEWRSSPASPQRAGPKTQSDILRRRPGR